MTLNANINNIVLISDFDGTISKYDFYKHVIKNFADNKNFNPFIAFLEGKISHIETLNLALSPARIEEDDFIKFIKTLPIEDDFLRTVKLCKSKGIDFYILSAGCDYYINIILEKLGILDDVTLYTNKSSYSKETGLIALPLDKDHPFYSDNYGICKKTATQTIKENYSKSIYIGDSMPDFESAKICDIIFARTKLMELCEKNNVKYNKYDSYKVIYDYVRNL